MVNREIYDVSMYQVLMGKLPYECFTTGPGLRGIRGLHLTL